MNINEHSNVKPLGFSHVLDSNTVPNQKRLKIVEIIFADIAISSAHDCKNINLKLSIQDHVCQVKKTNKIHLFKIYDSIYIISKGIFDSGNPKDISIAKVSQKPFIKGTSFLLYDLIYLDGCQRSDVLKLTNIKANIIKTQHFIKNECTALNEIHKNGWAIGIQALPLAILSNFPSQDSNIELGYLSIKYQTNGCGLREMQFSLSSDEATRITCQVILGLNALHASGRIHCNLCEKNLLYRKNELVIGGLGSSRKVENLSPFNKFPSRTDLFKEDARYLTSYSILEQIDKLLAENYPSYVDAELNKKKEIKQTMMPQIIHLMKESDKYALGLTLLKLWVGNLPPFPSYCFANSPDKFIYNFNLSHVPSIKEHLRKSYIPLTKEARHAILNLLLCGSDSLKNSREIAKIQKRKAIQKITTDLVAAIELSKINKDKKELENTFNRLSTISADIICEYDEITRQDFEKLNEIQIKTQNRIAKMFNFRQRKAFEIIYADAFKDQNLHNPKITKSLIKDKLRSINKENPICAIKTCNKFYVVSQEILDTIGTKTISIARRELNHFAEGSYGYVYNVTYLCGSENSDIFKLAKEGKAAEEALENEWDILHLLHKHKIIIGIQIPPHTLISFGYLSFKYPMNGKDLSEMILNNKLIITAEEINKLSNNIISALYYIHTKGIIHGDLKIRNLLYRKNDLVIGDFGGARRIATASFKVYPTIDNIFNGWIISTPCYISYSIYKKIEALLDKNKDSYDKTDSQTKNRILIAIMDQVNAFLKKNDKYALGLALFELWLGPLPPLNKLVIFKLSSPKVCYSFNDIKQIYLIKESLQKSYLSSEMQYKIMSLILEGI